MYEDDMSMEEMELFLENDPISQLITAAMRSNEEAVKVLIPQRFAEMMEAKELLETVLRYCFGEAEVKVGYHQAYCSGYLTAQIEAFEVCTKGARQAWARLMELSDVFEAVPLVNGNVELGFTFQHIMRAIG